MTQSLENGCLHADDTDFFCVNLNPLRFLRANERKKYPLSHYSLYSHYSVSSEILNKKIKRIFGKACEMAELWFVPTICSIVR